MDCTQARQLIDRRLDASEDDAPRDWSELDAHLSKCPACSAELLRLMRTRNLLAGIAADGPSNEETDKMWQAIQQAGPAAALTMQATAIRKRALRFVAACAGIAAVLTIALQLGRQEYVEEAEYVRTLAGLSGLGTASVGADGHANFITPSLDNAVLPAQPKTPARHRVEPTQEGSLTSGQVDSLRSLGYITGDVAGDWDSIDTISLGYGAPSAVDGVYQGRDDDLGNDRPNSALTMVFTSGSPAPALGEPPSQPITGEHGDQADVPVVFTKGGDENKGQPGQQPTTRLRIIKTGELTLEVPVYDEAASQVKTIVGDAGGFVADVQVEEWTGGALRGRIVVRVTPEQFEALFAALKQVGKVESENVKAADVTAQYVDLEARIRGLQITEQRLAELIQSKSFIDKVASLLEVEREMTRVRSQIEQLQGELRVMASRVVLSRIMVNLHEPARKVPTASMSVEVPAVAEAAEVLSERLAGLGGRLGSGKTAKRKDGTLRGDYKLHVSLAHFGELLEAIEGLGRVQERQITDRQFADATKPWADKVDCYVALVLYERTPQPPRATLMFEVDDVGAVRPRLNELLAPCRAAVMSSTTSRRDDGSSVSELRIRVPAGRFGELLDALAPLGRVLAKETAGETGRIVGGAASLPCDINLTLSEPARQVPRGNMAVEVEGFQSARDRLSALISDNGVQVLASSSTQRTDGTWTGRFTLGIKAADTDLVVGQLESFGRVVSRQITGTGLGELSRTVPDALGVIELGLLERAAIAPEPARAGQSVRGRLRDGLAGFYNSGSSAESVGGR